MNSSLGSSSLLNKPKPFRPPFKVPGPANSSSTEPTASKTTPNENSNSVSTTAIPATEENNTNTYFNLFYTKDVKKKNKSWSDGFVELSQSRVKMFDTDGNKLYDTARGRLFKDTPKLDEEYYLGSYLIQVQTPIKPEDFTSGRIFMKKEIKITTAVKQPTLVMKSGTLHQKAKTDAKEQSKPVEIKVPADAYVLVEGKTDGTIVPCYIDPYLGNKMRIHQKEGVKFMFECITGLRGQDITGCILADSMGLGKTLQTIGLIWTLIKQNPYSAKKPYVNRVIVLAPLSVVKNWEKEVSKWLSSTRLQPVVAIGEKDDVSRAIENFTTGSYRCLLSSYEVFMKYVDKLNNSCDLLILDEGHRLKNQENKLNQCFLRFNCKKRIILTGTPLQNRLEELHACCEFLNPNIFPALNIFRKVYINPITEGLKKGAKKDDQSLAKDRSKELSKMLGSFILRRPGSVMSSILPPKHEYFVLTKLTDAQRVAYKKILNYNLYNPETQGQKLDAFSLISVLRKLLNHPQLLVNDNSDSGRVGVSSFPENLYQMNLWESSVKFQFTKDMIDNMVSGDKILIVSYFTQTLDLIEKLCNSSNVKFLRLDGQVAGLKRQRLVDRFNDKTTDIKVFLLCGKAGGTGLNLTGANKMILFDADWNPSNDHQVMGRVWRDGQTKEAKIYRLFSCGTIEEKVMQRQFVKENLSLNVVDEKNIKSIFDNKDLKKIFKFEDDSKSIVFGENENEKEKFFESTQDFPPIMKTYVMFLKKKLDAVVEKKEKAVVNEFENEGIFMTKEKKEGDNEEVKEEDNENEDECEDDEEEVDDEDQEEEEDDEDNEKKSDSEEECYFNGSEKSKNEGEEEEKEQVIPFEEQKIEESIENKENRGVQENTAMEIEPEKTEKKEGLITLHLNYRREPPKAKEVEEEETEKEPKKEYKGKRKLESGNLGEIALKRLKLI